MATILIIDDQEEMRFSLARVVKKRGYSVMTAAEGTQGLEFIESTVVDLVFLDIGLPDINGMELIPKIRELDPEIDIIMLTGDNDARRAVQALRAGAIDYIVKPFDLLEFTSILDRSVKARYMARQARLAKMQEGEGSKLIGESRSMLRVKEGIGMASEVDSAVLITGETGTGKELVARTIHQSRKGEQSVFVKVDCGTLSSNLIESELFGHEKGAFTDARSDKKGLVEVANGGTLFLDEIGNMPLELQPKLLRLIEESTFRRVGGLSDIRVDIRIIAATNADLVQQIEAGEFRQDLFYRLNIIPLPLPPLRHRGNDILLLAHSFLTMLTKELKKDVRGFSDLACEKMIAYDWPGNIRELRNLIEREVIFNRDGLISMDSLPSARTTTKKPARLSSLREVERQHIRRVLDSCGGNKSRAARILGITRTTLRDKLARE